MGMNRLKRGKGAAYITFKKKGQFCNKLLLAVIFIQFVWFFFFFYLDSLTWKWQEALSSPLKNTIKKFKRRHEREFDCKLQGLQHCSWFSCLLCFIHGSFSLHGDLCSLCLWERECFSDDSPLHWFTLWVTWLGLGHMIISGHEGGRESIHMRRRGSQREKMKCCNQTGLPNLVDVHTRGESILPAFSSSELWKDGLPPQQSWRCVLIHSTSWQFSS